MFISSVVTILHQGSPGHWAAADWPLQCWEYYCCKGWAPGCLNCLKYVVFCSHWDLGGLSLSSRPGYHGETEAGAGVPGRRSVPGEWWGPARGHHRSLSSSPPLPAWRATTSTGRQGGPLTPATITQPPRGDWLAGKYFCFVFHISNKSASLGLFSRDHETETLCKNWQKGWKYLKKYFWDTITSTSDNEPGCWWGGGRQDAITDRVYLCFYTGKLVPPSQQTGSRK